MVIRDTYLQPGAPDPVLEPEAVLEIVRRFAPAREVTGVDESGGEARAYMVDDGIVFKTQRPHRLRPRTSLEKEAFLLDHIARHSELSVPRVLGYGRADDVEYICMTRMPGSAVRHLDLTGEKRYRTLFGLGRGLSELHSLPQTDLFASPLMPGDHDDASFRVRMESMVHQAISAIAASMDTWPLAIPPEKLGARLLEGLQPPRALIALHSNPGPEHAFADAATFAFTGLIDFGDSYISHPALDLRVWTRPGDRQGVIDGYIAEGGASEADIAEWRTVWAIADMSVIALRPDRRPAAIESLKGFLADFGP